MNRTSSKMLMLPINAPAISLNTTLRAALELALLTGISAAVDGLLLVVTAGSWSCCCFLLTSAPDELALLRYLSEPILAYGM